MDFFDYEMKSRRTSNTKTASEKIENGILGLSGEAGEVIDLWKKYKFQGHPLDKKIVATELGDVLWYIRELAEGLGYSMEEIAEINIEKLKKRFPEGFEVERSIERSE